MVGTAQVTVKVKLSNGKRLSQTFLINVMNQVKNQQKITGYRLVNKNANIWTRPYYKASRNHLRQGSTNVKGTMIRLKEKVTMVDGKHYYLVALPGADKKIGWISVADSK